MKQLTLKNILRYGLALAAAAALFAYLYRDQDLDAMLDKFSKVEYSWIFLSIAISIISHISRGWRWVIALRPLGYNTSPFKAFLAVMIGYIANLVLPRAGEVARCAVFRRMERVPVGVSFGAVVAERILDLLILISLVSLTVVLEFERIGGFLTDKIGASAEGLQSKVGLLIGLGIIGLGGLITLFLMRKRLKKLPLYGKIKSFLSEIRQGLTSILKLSPAEKTAFVFHTLVIWVMYYLMTYVLFFCMEETSALGFAPGMIVLIMGGIGMAVPVQGGIGTYHLFVTYGLLTFGVDEEIGKYFSFLTHSSQTLMVIIVGGLSFLLSTLLARNVESGDKSPEDDTRDEKNNV